jgi:hypothetical protein
MKVYIHSKPRTYSAYSLNQMRDPDTGQLLEKSKYGRTRDKLMALYSGKVGGLLNGLSYKPWLDENGKQIVEEGKKLTLQQKQEDRWNLSKDYLTNRAWRRGDSLKEEDMTYFQTRYWPLQDGTTILDIDKNFDDCMFYHVALDSKFIANSEREYIDRKWPFATHYISLAGETDEIAYAKNKEKIKAIATLEDKRMTQTWKERFVHILGLSSVFNSLTEEQIENTLFRYIQTDSKFGFASNITKYMNLYSKLGTADGKKELNARHLLVRALETRVISEKADTYTWNRAKGPIVIGNKYSEAIDFLINPDKQTYVEDLELEIKSKML